MRYDPENPGPELPEPDYQAPEIVPGLRDPEIVQELIGPPRQESHESFTKKIGEYLGMAFVACIFLMILAMILVILAGITVALWGVFFG